MKKEKDEMTTKEVARLAEWLKANNISPTKIIECIRYIAGVEEPKKKKSTVRPPK